jgi:Transposase DDE domain
MAAFDLALTLVRHADGDLLLADRINQLARAQKHLFRDTTLTPGRTLQLFVRQVARGNIACAQVRYLADQEFSDSAWCQARARLPLELIEHVHRQIIEQGRCQLNQRGDVGAGDYLWRGHRLHVVDGSSDSMPDTPELRSHYGVPGACVEGLGFPTSHLLLMMDHRSGLLISCHDAPGNTHDASTASTAHPHLREGDVLMGDDAFGTYTHLSLLLQANLHAIMPVHHKRIVNFTPGRPSIARAKNTHKSSAGKPRSRLVRTLGKDDQLVEYSKPPNKPQWMTHQQWARVPESILVREIRRTVQRHGFRPITVTIVTTLLDPQRYPADELIELRLTRWMVETNLRHLKITLGMDVLKCKTLQGVRKERSIFLLVYNLIRLAMIRAAWRQEIHVNRLSFADALAWIRHGDVTMSVSLKINPFRPGRMEPRAIKRPSSRFPHLTRPRDKLKAELLEKHQVAT